MYTTEQEVREALEGAQTVEELREVAIRYTASPVYSEALNEALKSRKAGLEEKVLQISIKPWLARKHHIPREIDVVVLQETNKAVLVRCKVPARETSTCLMCGRPISHPVSVFYGIGPICGNHFHLPRNPTDAEEMKRILAEIVWEMWLPKSQILSGF